MSAQDNKAGKEPGKHVPIRGMKSISKTGPELIKNYLLPDKEFK